MPKPYRYTDDFPPPDVIEKFPNWELAANEEEEENQDETTIRPQEEQSCINEDTVVTAAQVTLASGKQFVGLVGVAADGLDDISVFENGEWWRLEYDQPSERWEPFEEDWLREGAKSPAVSLDDPRVFPLRFVTRLPRKSGGSPYEVEIRPDGTSTGR